MEVIINNTTYEVPFDLGVITLGMYVKYYDKFGRELDKQFSNILSRKYNGDPEEIELNRQLDIDDHIDNEALAWYSFHTGHDLMALKNTPMVEPLLTAYRLFRFRLKDSMEEVKEFPSEIEWNGQLWMIQDFKVNPASEMNFNEIITSKEIIRQIFKIGKGKWDAMPYLCAVFFRKKNEAFKDVFIQENSERLTLMQSLPMSYAVQVAFFLTTCVATWKNILVFSNEEDQEEIPSLK